MDGEKVYYLYNGHADVTALINSNGTVIASYYYDAFGEIVEQTGDYHNPYRYSGYHYDEESELYDLKARFYDAKLARFMQDDTYWHPGNMIYGDDPLQLNEYTYMPSLNSMRQSINVYAYCLNHPLIYSDPDGNQIILDLLVFPGEIHKQVSLQIIADNATLLRERWLKYHPQAEPLEWVRGRVDLVDINTGYIWETKPEGWSREATIAQLEGYVTGGEFFNKTLKDKKPTIYNGIPETDGYVLDGKFGYKYWDVSYWYVSNGIIEYRADLNGTRLQQHFSEVNAKEQARIMAYLIAFGLAAGWRTQLVY